MNSNDSFVLWKHRPPSVQTKIDEEFARINSKRTSDWFMNGSNTYGICGVDEHQLIKSLITKARGRSTFYIMDVGAGNFQWGDNMAAYINKETEIGDVTVHIISVRGEQYIGDKVVVDGKCVIYKCGGVKVENITEYLQKEKFFQNADNTLDLIVTRWCLRHLVDPVGCFEQLYHLLRPKTGFLFMDGFVFFLDFESRKLSYSEISIQNFCMLYLLNGHRIRDAYMLHLFFGNRIPFLIGPYSKCNSYNWFVLRRPDEARCNLFFLQYANEVFDRFCRHDCYISRYLVTFNCSLIDKTEIMSSYLQKHIREDVNFGHDNSSLLELSGCRELYDFFAKEDLFVKGKAIYKHGIDLTRFFQKF